MPGRTGALHPRDIKRVRVIRKLGIETARNGEFFYGKMYIRPKTFLFKGMHAAQRVFLKRISTNFFVPRPPFDKRELAPDLKVAHDEMKIRHYLKRLGLPVPKAGVVQVKSGKHKGVYLAISPFLQGRGKKMKSRLQSVNPFFGDPIFLRQLDPTRDKETIQGMARATATMYNHGVGAEHFDFFGLYPRENVKWGFVIMDSGDLHWWHGPKEDKRSIPNLLQQVRAGSGNMWQRDYDDHLTVYGLFYETFMKHLRPELK